jgi:hypothetical protein
MSKGGGMSQADRDNHANQLNPNNDAYWNSRDDSERPEDWEDQAQQERQSPNSNDQGKK